MNSPAIQKKVAKIKEIYRQYEIQLNQLKSKQDQVIQKLIKKLEEEKLRKLRNLLK